MWFRTSSNNLSTLTACRRARPSSKMIKSAWKVGKLTSLSKERFLNHQNAWSYASLRSTLSNRSSKSTKHSSKNSAQINKKVKIRRRQRRRRMIRAKTEPWIRTGPLPEVASARNTREATACLCRSAALSPQCPRMRDLPHWKSQAMSKSKLRLIIG